MGTGQLGDLALISVHYDHNVDYNEVAELIFQLFPKKLGHISSSAFAISVKSLNNIFYSHLLHQLVKVRPVNH